MSLLIEAEHDAAQKSKAEAGIEKHEMARMGLGLPCKAQPRTLGSMHALPIISPQPLSSFGLSFDSTSPALHAIGEAFHYRN